MSEGLIVPSSTASSSRAASTVEYLLKQQCADGGFRVSMADEQCGTPGAEQGPTVDATAFALQALGVAREHGISGLDDDVAEALRTMVDHDVRRLPVIDGHDLVGMLAQADIARALPPQQVGELVGAISEPG